MENPMRAELTSKYVVTIPTDEYADLLAARTRLDVICGLLNSKEYLDKEIVLIVAQGMPQPTLEPEADEEYDPIF